jgi:hypothetical protein
MSSTGMQGNCNDGSDTRVSRPGREHLFKLPRQLATISYQLRSSSAQPTAVTVCRLGL